MLTGTIVYKGNHIYNVTGIDYSSNMNLLITSKSYDSRLLLSGDPELCSLDVRRVNINLTNIVVQTEKTKPAAGKAKKVPVNNDLFCRLGALIRYAKVNCRRSNQIGYTGLTLASGEFDTLAISEYHIKYPMEPNKELAKVVLAYGDIVEIELKTEYFEIKLKDDPSVEVVLDKITDGMKLGFKIMDKDYLGFDVPAQEPINTDELGSMYTCIEEVIAAHPDKEFSWLLGKDYRIVDDEHLDEICDYIMNYDGYVYYDTETTGLNINFKSRIGQADQLVGVVLSVKFGESFFFPTQMKSIPNLCGGDHFYFMERYMRPILEGKELVAHNMTYDWKVAYIYDINANIVHDTMALIKLTLGAEKDQFPMGLKACSQILLKRDSLELSDLLVDNKWGENEIKFWDLPYELVRLYACADTDNTNGLLQYALQADLLTKYGARKIYDIEIAFSYAVAYQEFYGHRLDITHMFEIRESLGKEQADLMSKMVDMVGHDFNVNSPAQLTKVLYEEMNVPPQYSGKTKNLTTDKKTLLRLAEETDINDEPKYPIVDLLVKYRQLEGVRKIVDKFPERMTEDGYLFSDVMQYGTSTGRVSIHNPNYQSYSDTIKKNIVPRPGFWMFDTDYSSVEYRVLGNMVGNKAIMESFKDPDFDYHQYQAARMFRVPYNTVTKKMRKRAKGLNFGLPYGMGDNALGEILFGEKTKENAKKAEALRIAYFEGQEDIRDWFEHHRDHGVNNGFTETYFGRRRYYDKTKYDESRIRRQAGNQVIQGCISGDTRILTYENGIIKLKDAVGYNYLIWDGKAWTSGDVLYSGKKKKCIVKFKGGQSIVCSPQHKFLVRSHRGKDRWVECKDLIGTVDNKNSAHRVVINEQYEPANHKYSSKFAHKYASKVHNANNVFLEDIHSSFDIGVFLGRLASDGTMVKGKEVTHIIAEHEYNIMPELYSCMQALKPIVTDRGIREGRNEGITNITVCSKALSEEIAELDIKHQVHDNIFADTEVLRGFLSGFFDGDGGISGKTIALTFGVQFEFEPMILDLQKALLFFGIRSRYHRYKDRYRLVIRTTDNERFLDIIGFLNQDKQDAGRALKCVEDEHVYGKCLLVESVEITDELIDMYDVCNTERGYFVADGIITHNTAADIYKLAVGRVFKRICKEGLLGKVMLTGFIHDELLGEVSNEVNPAIWLKILREEYEVKINNQDGTPWSPLYMGFGYGTSWYEAKSVELPIKLQWEIVQNYGETGFPFWDGNGRKFCDYVPVMLRDFDVRDICNQLQDPANQGKDIKPTLNNQLLGCIKEDIKTYNDAKGNIDEMQKNFVGYNIKDEHGNVVEEISKPEDLQDVITLFCKLHNVDRDKVDILNPIESAGDAATSELITDALAGAEEFVYEDGLSEEEKLRIMDAKVQYMGYYLDIDKREIILLLPGDWKTNPKASMLMKLVLANTNDTGDGYLVILKDYDNEAVRTTERYVSSMNVPAISKLYSTYLSGRVTV